MTISTLFKVWILASTSHFPSSRDIEQVIPDMSLVTPLEIMQPGGLAIHEHTNDEKHLQDEVAAYDSKEAYEHVEVATGAPKAGAQFREIQEAGISAENFELSLTTWECVRLYRKVG